MTLTPPKKDQRFSASALKLIAVVSMTLDHLAWAFVPLDSFSGQILHALGRFAFPLFAFLMAEGFWHTRNLKRYVMRVGVFAFLAHLPFQYFALGRLPLWQQSPLDGIFTPFYTSILFPFFLGLLCLTLYYKTSLKPAVKYAGVFLLSVLAMLGDYGYFATLGVFFFGRAKGNRTQTLQSGALVLGFLVVLVLMPAPRDNLFMLATFFPLGLIAAYNGTLGFAQSQKAKMGFYLFYPLHFLLLGLLKYTVLHQGPIFPTLGF